MPRLGPHSINLFAICFGKALFKGVGTGGVVLHPFPQDYNSNKENDGRMLMMLFALMLSAILETYRRG